MTDSVDWDRVNKILSKDDITQEDWAWISNLAENLNEEDSQELQKLRKKSHLLGSEFRQKLINDDLIANSETPLETEQNELLEDELKKIETTALNELRDIVFYLDKMSHENVADTEITRCSDIINACKVTLDALFSSASDGLDMSGITSRISGALESYAEKFPNIISSIESVLPANPQGPDLPDFGS